MTFPYHSMEQLIMKVSEPDQTILQTVLEDNRKEFEGAMGSEHNHQAWRGGYLDHITETMNLGCLFYGILGGNLPFTLSSALKTMFWHDGEKPWRFIRDSRGRITQKCLKTKKEKADFRQGFMEDYGVSLSSQEHNAMRYVEGEHRRAKPSEQVLKPLTISRFPVGATVLNALAYIEGSHGDYRNRKRSEGALATFCHLWWTTMYIVRPKGTTFTLKSLYQQVHSLRPLPFTLRDAELVRQLYLSERARTDFTTFEHLIREFVPYGISYGQWKSLTGIVRYPRERPLPQHMRALAGFCHMCDVASARLWHNHPLVTEDPWLGATRSAT